MFKRFKDRLNEVSEEVKRDPRFVNGIASVNQLAQQTVSALKNEGSNENLQVNFISGASDDAQVGISQDSNHSEDSHHKRSHSSDLQTFFNQPVASSAALSASASSPALSSSVIPTPMASNSFFSLTEDDDAPISEQETFSNVDLQNPQQQHPHSSSNSPNHRARRLSSSSMSTEAANLFPIYESPQQIFSFPVNADLDSTAGSEWEEDAASSQQRLTSVSKEQLFQMLQKARARYHKYKGRYTDLSKAFQDLERENGKIKGVMQQTQVLAYNSLWEPIFNFIDFFLLQDKALRRISELKEQCQLEQKAKRHLEEELRSDLEEKHHVIEALQTKVSLLKSGGKGVLDENNEDNATGNLVDISDDNSATSVASDIIQRDGDKIANLEGKLTVQMHTLQCLIGCTFIEKIKRLEGLLTKCKESIKANKQKTTALTEVKESLAKQVGEREAESDDLRSQLVNLQSTLAAAQTEISNHKKREQSEELQIAELKLLMHQEMITKDEEIGKLRLSLKSSMEQDSDKEKEIAQLKQEMEEMSKQQVIFEQSMESEKAAALQEISRGKSSALQALNTEMEKRLTDLQAEHENHQEELVDNHRKELSQLLDTANREKMREIALKEEEMRKRLNDKEEEGKLALEELELRLSSSSNAADNSKKLISDLETAVKNLKKEKESLTDQLEELKNELTTVCSSIQNELKEELSQLQAKLNHEEGMKLKLMEEKSQLKSDLEKQICDLQNRESSLKCNEQKMITYQKELQEKINQFEKEHCLKKDQVDKLQMELEDKCQEVQAIERRNQAEIIQLKADLDMKIRHEREKETSFKDLQVQSIEYQKKLQEQLTDMEAKLDKERMKHKTIVNELNANIKTLQGEVEKEQQEELRSMLEDERTLKLQYEAMITELQTSIEKLEKDKSQREQDTVVLEEHIKQKGTDLESKDKEIQAIRIRMTQLEEEINDYQSELSMAKEDVKGHEDKCKCLEAENSELKTKLESMLNAEMDRKVDDDTKVSNMEAKEVEMISQMAQLKEDVKSYQMKFEAAHEEASKLLQSMQAEQQKFKDLEDEISRMKAQLDAKQTEIEEKAEDIKEFEEDHKELEAKVDLAQQMMYDAQNAASSKDGEIEDLKSNLTARSEELEGAKKELKSCQTDKAAQMIEFEESLVGLERDNAELKTKVEQLQEEITGQNHLLQENQELGQQQSLLEEQHEQAVKSLVKKYEQALSAKEESKDLELGKIREDHEIELKRTVQELTTQIATLRQDLYEKSAMYDQVIETHQSDIRAKQEELEDEVAHCTRMYQSKIGQVQSEYQERLKELEQRYQEENNSWNWERATSIDEEVLVEDLQRTPTREQVRHRHTLSF